MQQHLGIILCLIASVHYIILLLKVLNEICIKKHNQMKLKISLEKLKYYSKRVWKLSGATTPSLVMQSLCRINRWNKLSTFREIFTVRFPETKISILWLTKRKGKLHLLKPPKRLLTCAHIFTRQQNKNASWNLQNQSPPLSFLNKQICLAFCRN